MLSSAQPGPISATTVMKLPVFGDKWLVLTSVVLLALGLLMVASASMPVSEDRFSQPFYYVIRQGMAIGIGLLLAVFIGLTPLRLWQHMGLWIMFGLAILLVLVLIPGIGRGFNNSMRWISFGVITLQVSELAKLGVIIYTAGFLARHNHATRLSLRDALGPGLLIAGLVFLLLKEPDYGASVVLIVTVMGMLFLAKFNIWHFVALLSGAAVTMIAILSMAAYRWSRLACFLDPWSEPYGCGYQLTQSLIAVGSGGFFGVGLGASVQKLHYLPEAYNDFLFAVLAEELGLVGIVSGRDFIRYRYLAYVSNQCRRGETGTPFFILPGGRHCYAVRDTGTDQYGGESGFITP